MTPERWQQVKGLLAATLEIDPAQRSAYLNRVCAGDPALQAEVDELLAIEQGTDPELLDTPSMAMALAETPAPHARIGRRIGPYQIVEEIGVGGMGEVYRAFRADDQYHKQVAIKLVRAGHDSSFVVARFKNERQVLASLDHPNVARLLDGGTTEEGLPYFVMELIDGKPIHQYCDEHKFPTTERLKLFLHVCWAVQYAHQRLIIHRDLKPSNILVTKEGIPKLLDFGIAKILDPAAVLETLEPTMSMLRLFTPAYASPEQIKGEAITTASDVYSLGVLLYELLTGHRPYLIAGQAPHEIAQAVCEFEPERPSTVLWRTDPRETADGRGEITPASISSVRDGFPEKLSRRLRGDLDNIILMALRKDPQRRYASVEQFAEDIRRHLENLPVSARTDSIRYRMSKFNRRHKAGVAAGVIVAVAVLTGLATTLHEAHIARVQQLRAEQRFNDVRELANSLLFDVHDSIQDLPGSTPARKLLVERALRYLDGLSRDAASDASLQGELATAYEKVATVQGNPFGANLGDTKGALDSYGKALAIRETLSKANPNDVEDQLALARTQRLLAATLANRAEGWDQKITMDKELLALASAERAYQMAPANPATMQELQSNYDLLVTFRRSTGDYQGAWEYLQKEQPVAEALLRTTSDNRSLQVGLGKIEAKSGIVLGRSGDRKEAMHHLQRAMAIFEGLSANGTDASARRYLAITQDVLGDTQLMDGQVGGALASYRKEVEILEPLLAGDPTNAVAQFEMATALAKVGNASGLTGHSSDGLAMLKRAAAMLESQIKADPSYSEPPWSLVSALLWMGEAFERNGDPGSALKNYREVLRMWEANKHPLARTIVADTHVKLARALAKTGNRQEASEEADLGLKIAEEILAIYPYMIDAQYVLAYACSELGELTQMAAVNARGPRQQLQHWNDARRWYQQSSDAWSKIHNPGSTTPLGFACGNPKKVAQQLAKCDAALSKLKSPN